MSEEKEGYTKLDYLLIGSWIFAGLAVGLYFFLGFIFGLLSVAGG